MDIYAIKTNKNSSLHRCKICSFR